MLQGASEECITGRTLILIGYRSSKAVWSPLELPKPQDINQKAKQMKMLS